MTAYEELLEFGGERIFDFLKNARLHESQFKYSEFNEVCYKKMYIENNQDSIKTVKELKEEIPELKDTCKGCGSYFMNPRNKSIKGLDVQFGRLLEDVIIDFLKTKYKLNVTHGDNSNKKYPDCMLLSGDKGILAYFEVKYHGAPFISAINKIGTAVVPLPMKGSRTISFSFVPANIIRSISFSGYCAGCSVRSSKFPETIEIRHTSVGFFNWLLYRSGR